MNFETLMTRSIRSTRQLLLVICLAIGTMAALPERCASGQDLTPKQKQAVKIIATNIDRAGKQYKSKKFEASAKYIRDAMAQIDALATTASPELMKLLEPEYERLAKAHKLLTASGQKLGVLKELPIPMTGGELVSFKKSVAPILIAKCGNCHVTRNRGDFSAATFEALDKSTMLAYGLPDDSRLIQVIESGEMPKGGAKIEPKELAILRAWMKQGAKYDGDNPRQPLGELTGTPAPPNRNRQRIEPKMPTGKETVSFGLHVAPILLNNCAQCHINNNPRSNFSMANFRDLLRGGDGGTPFESGKSAESAIVKRLRGDGVDVMPPRGKLDDKDINVIAKWIDEGGAFDGPNSQMETQLVAATVKAGSQTHAELAADREVLANETWKLVMSDVESTALMGKNFVVTGSTTESRLTDVKRLCEKLAPKIASSLRTDTKQPLVKGNISIFVFDKRYDFSEFGKMVEKLDFPKEVSGHWGYTIIDAYSTILMTRNQKAEDVQISLAHQIASLHVASLASDMPRWFADGMGLWTARKILSREDDMKTIDSRAEAAAAKMIKPDDFVTNEMPADKAALVSYLFIKRLRSNSSAFGKLMKGIEGGAGFQTSFKAAYGGTPSELLGQKRKKR